MNIKTKRALTIALTVLLVAVMLVTGVACKAKPLGKIKTGEWKDGTFTNKWSNLKIDLPEGYARADSAKIADIVAKGLEAMTDEQTTEAQREDNKNRTAYDLVIYATGEVASPYLTLTYENLSVLKDYKDLDAAGYLTELGKQLPATYAKVGDNTNETVASASYTKASYTVESGLQDVYVRKVDGAFIVISVAYTTENKDVADSLIAAFKKVK